MTSMQIFYMVIAAVIVSAVFLLRFIYKKSFMLQTPVIPKPPLPCQPDDYYLPYENVLFTAADGVVLKGWFIPSTNEDSSETVIICHGRGSNKGQLLQKTHFLAEKYNLFYFDFRACGESKGNMSTIGYMETRDFDAAYTFLKTNKVITESTFLSLRSVVENWCRSKMPLFTVFVPLTLSFYRRRLKTDPELFSPLFNAPRLKCPVLFIHGDNDRLIPETDRKELVNICGSSYKEEFIVSGATHTKCAETGGVMYRERISAFLEKISCSADKNTIAPAQGMNIMTENETRCENAAAAAQIPTAKHSTAEIKTEAKKKKNKKKKK